MAAPMMIYRSGAGPVIPALLSVGKELHLRDKMRIDTTFLPVKAVYFLLCIGNVCIDPFLSVYFAYIGLNPLQIGIAIGIQPFLSIIASPLCGSLADKYRLHRVLLITAVLAVGLGFGSGVFVPFLNANGANRTVPWTNTSNETASFDKQRLNVGLRLTTLCADRAEGGCEQYERVVETGLQTLQCKTEFNQVNATISKCLPNYPEAEFNNGIWADSSGGKNTTVFVFPVIILYLILVQCGVSSLFPILDSTTMALIQECKKRGHHAEYGRQRLWGAIGAGLFAPLSGLAVDLYSVTHPESFNRYLISFILCTSFYLLAVLPALLIPMPPRQRPKSLSRDVGCLLRKPHVLMFFFVLFVSGVSIGVINTYLFLFLQQLSGSHTLMGLTRTLTCAAEVPFMFFAAWFIKKLSQCGVFSLALFCFALRFAGYALLSNPWLVLPIELLHGITQGAMWPAAASYVIVISPESSRTTIQTLAYCTRLGLGRGVGILLGGVIYHHYGARVLFRAMAVVCGGTLAVYLPASAYFERREAMVRRLQVQYEEI